MLKILDEASKAAIFMIGSCRDKNGPTARRYRKMLAWIAKRVTR